MHVFVCLYVTIPYDLLQYDTLKSIFLSDPEKASNFWYKWAVSQANTVLAQTLVYP